MTTTPTSPEPHVTIPQDGDPSAKIAVAELVARYIDRFNARAFTEALECYRLPFTWLFGPRAITAHTPDEFLRMMDQSWNQLKDEGLARSVLISTDVGLLDDDAALVAVVVARVRTDGSELERKGGSYLVHRKKGQWRLIAFASHPIGRLATNAFLSPASDLDAALGRPDDGC